LTDDTELIQLREKVIKTFNAEGEFVVLNKLDTARFDSVARINVKESTFNFLFDIWNYFYSSTFFIPAREFTFSDYISFQQSIKFQDKWGEKLLQRKSTAFECIKGLGGDNLIISYQNDFLLPDLKKVALSTPDVDELFR